MGCLSGLELSRVRKYGLQTDRISLWVSKTCPPQARVTSHNCSVRHKSSTIVKKLAWWSFHLSRNSSCDILLFGLLVFSLLVRSPLVISASLAVTGWSVSGCRPVSVFPSLCPTVDCWAIPAINTAAASCGWWLAGCGCGCWPPNYTHSLSLSLCLPCFVWPCGSLSPSRYTTPHWHCWQSPGRTQLLCSLASSSHLLGKFLK